jgi:hypothetical protein
VPNQAPNNSDALAGLGFVRLNQGKFDDAQKLLANAITTRRVPASI